MNTIANWKNHPMSTAAGVLTVIFVLCTAITTYVSEHPNSPAWLLGTAAGATAISGVLKIFISMVQADAGTVMALTPGSSTPSLVSSHEIPDNPQDRAVKTQ